MSIKELLYCFLVYPSSEKLPPVFRGRMLNQYVFFMIALNFARRHLHFISVTSTAHIAFHVAC